MWLRSGKGPGVEGFIIVFLVQGVAKARSQAAVRPLKESLSRFSALASSCLLLCTLPVP